MTPEVLESTVAPPTARGAAPRTVTLVGTGLALVAGSVGFEGFGSLAPVLVALAGVVLGFSHPRRAWRWAVLVVVCFAVAQLLLRILHLDLEERVPQPVDGNLAGLAALVGAYLGAGLERIVVRLEHEGLHGNTTES